MLLLPWLFVATAVLVFHTGGHMTKWVGIIGCTLWISACAVIPTSYLSTEEKNTVSPQGLVQKKLEFYTKEEALEELEARINDLISGKYARLVIKHDLLTSRADHRIANQGKACGVGRVYRALYDTKVPVDVFYQQSSALVSVLDQVKSKPR